MATRKLEVLITGDASSLEKSLGKTQTAATGFAAKFGKVAKIGGAVGIALGGTAVALGKTVKAAQESEKAQFRLESALKSAGVSQQKYGKSIQDNINKTSRLAALDDEDLSDAFAKLVRTTGDVTKATEGMNLAADIARSRNVSLEAATKAVERAFTGSATGLKRFGVEVAKTTSNADAVQTRLDAVKASLKGQTGAQAEATKVLINDLEVQKDAAKEMDKKASALNTLENAQRQFAGAAEDYGKTSAAAQERFGVAMENVQELIGAKVLPILATLAEKLLQLLNWVILNWPRFQRVVEDVMDNVKVALDRIRPVLDALFKTWESIIRLVIALVKGDWSEAWTQFKNVVTNAVDYVRELLGLAWAGIKKAAVALGGAVIAGIKEGLEGIGMAAWGLINNIGERIVEFRDKIIGWGAGIAKSLVTGLLDGLSGLGKAIIDKIKDAFDWVRDHMPKLPSIDIPFIGGGGDAGNPSMTHPGSRGGGIDLRGASPVMMPFAIAAQSLGLSVTPRGGLRPGAITANGTPSDHGIGKALDLAGPASSMAAFFKALLGNPAVKQAFYDPLGSIFGGAWSSYREGGHSDHVHVATYDQGGVLRPGLTLAYNGTGRNEYVSNGSGGGDIIIQVDGETLARVNRRYAEKHARRNG